MTKQPEDHLPKKAPKKTGKSGIGPKPDPADESPAPPATAPASRKPELLVDANKRPKQSRLPTMEDAKIEELEDLAGDYAAVRDKRQKLTLDEVELKQDLLDLMKANKKETYLHNGIEIRVVHEKENVKVKIKKDKDED
jgi:hypothetical protein